MEKIERNARCPCESGRKYKHCCGRAKPVEPKPPLLEGLVPTVRMKGGIRSNPTGTGFIAIVHQWDNVECRGEPAEWRHPQIFSTEEEAMGFYKAAIRPGLEQLTKYLSNQKGVTST